MTNYKTQYFDKMKPYAERASKALGIPVSVILAQWAHESDYGRSWGARHRNNHAGISNFTGKPYSWSKAYKVEPRPSNEGAWYNVYRSIDDFVDDYIHVMNLGYYDKVREAGKTQGVEDDVLELGKSPFAGNHYKKNGVPGGAIMDMIKANNLTKYDYVEYANKINDDEIIQFKSTNDKPVLLVLGATALAILAMKN